MATVLITGASRGIGFELCRQYVEAGDRVIACVRSPAKAIALEALARSSDGRLGIYAMDVGETPSVEAASRAIDGPIDILLNNAGVHGGPHQSLGDIDEKAWIEALRIMTIGPVMVLQHFLPHMLKAKNPKAVTLTSQLGASTWPYGGDYFYVSAKAAVNRVMRSIAIDLKDKPIAIALIHPGWVRTDMGGMSATLSPEESASGIRRVIHGLSRDQSGQFFNWNGAPHPW